jgi:hypothetical protein
MIKIGEKVFVVDEDKRYTDNDCIEKVLSDIYIVCGRVFGICECENKKCYNVKFNTFNKYFPVDYPGLNENLNDLKIASDNAKQKTKDFIKTFDFLF